MNTKKGLIGVIVPVYKVEKYIAECIESILAQTYTNFRLILVDDGTPDNAGKICDEYANKDSRITVIHQENAGVTRARARGVEEAKDCEFIMFVDGDDTITIDAISQLHIIADDNTDIALSLVDKHFNPDSKIISTDTFVGMLLKDKSMCVASWGKLYRKSCFSKDIFDISPTIRICEDLIMNLRIAFKCKGDITTTKEQIYIHRINLASVTNTFYRNHEYEALLHKTIISSIPSNKLNDYITLTIPRRLMVWRCFWGYKYQVKGMKYCAFYQELKKDIKIHKYELSTIDKIIFKYENPIIRFLAINIKKVCNLLLYRTQ